MLRWLLRLQSDRGGQHAEAGVLMATLIVLAGAVTVGSVPQLSTAVADQWVCHISDRGNERCGGTTADGEEPAGQGFTAKTFGSTTTATTAAYVDPTQSHGPRTNILGDGSRAFVDGRRVDMRSCERDLSSCVGEEGTLYECTLTFGAVGLLGGILRQLECSKTLTDRTGLICTDEGLSTSTDTCKGPGGYFHCSNPSSSGERTCTEADNDADTHPPGLSSCGAGFGDDSKDAVCLGTNGTLYQCPSIFDADSESDASCPTGGRNIPTDAFKDKDGNDTCVEVTTHSSGTNVDNPNGGGRVVQCTYTANVCFNASGTCEQQQVSVRCLKDGPSDPNPEYQHCQSLGQVVEDGSSLQSICLVASAPGTCTAAETVTTSRPPPLPPGSDSVEVGGLDISIGADETIDVPTSEGTSSLSFDELTDLCTTDPGTCDDLIDSTVGQGTAEAEATLRDLGICTDDCAAFLDQAADSLSTSASNDGVDTGVQLSALTVGGLVVGGLVIGEAGPVALGSTIIAGTLISMFAVLRKSATAQALGGRAKAAIIAAGTQMIGTLRTGLRNVRDVWQAQFSGLPAAQREQAANRLFLHAAELMEQGQAGGG